MTILVTEAMGDANGGVLGVGGVRLLWRGPPGGADIWRLNQSSHGAGTENSNGMGCLE